MDQNFIIKEIKSGNRKTLENIYTMYRRSFIDWSTRTFRISTDEAIDIYQQTILAFYENIMGGKLNDVRGNLRTYLFAIGKYKVHELHRYQGKVMNLGDQVPDFEETDRDKPEGIERLLNLSKECLHLLGYPCREVLESYYYHRQSMRDIADRLGYKNEQTAKNQKYKCLLRLREIFRQETEKQKEFIYG